MQNLKPVGFSGHQELGRGPCVFGIPFIWKVPIRSTVTGCCIPRTGNSPSAVGRLNPKFGSFVGIGPELVPPAGRHRQPARHPLGIVVPKVVQVLQKAFAAGLLAPRHIGVERSLGRDIGVTQEIEQGGIAWCRRHRVAPLAGEEFLNQALLKDRGRRVNGVAA